MFIGVSRVPRVTPIMIHRTLIKMILLQDPGLEQPPDLKNLSPKTREPCSHSFKIFWGFLHRETDFYFGVYKGYTLLREMLIIQRRQLQPSDENGIGMIARLDLGVCTSTYDPSRP